MLPASAFYGIACCVALLYFQFVEWSLM